MAQIINVVKERFPSLRFVGKRYTDADRQNGSFAHKWGELFENDWFKPLEAIGEVKEVENGYIGLMRCAPSFEYWIGMFLPADAPALSGYEYMDIQPSDVGICWIKGKEDEGEIYCMHESCLQKMKESGMSNEQRIASQKALFFERYNCPRFTTKDSEGNVILDYGIYLD